MIAPQSPIANGFSQLSEGLTEPSGGSEPYTSMIAITENSTSTRISVPSSSTWLRALSSMPVTQIQVIARMNRQPSTAIAQ